MPTRLKPWTLCAALLLGACGDDPPPPRRQQGTAAKKDATSPSTGGGGGKPAAATPGKPGGKVVTLQTYPKVADEYRKALDKPDFAPDATGDLNRDPWRSYLIDLAQLAGKGKKGQPLGEGGVEDECEEQGVVAERFGLRDLKLTGTVMRGTRSWALFTDSQNIGHHARRGDCVSKERARVKDIGADRVTLEIRGQAPPGAPAPPPREEVWKVHAEELELEMGSGGGRR